MSSKGSVLSIIRGGQITIHYIRMAKQVVSLYIKLSLLMFLVVFSLFFFSKTTLHDRGYAFDYFFSYSTFFIGGYEISIPIYSKGSYIKMKNINVLRNKYIKNKYEDVKVVFIRSSFYGSFSLLITAFMVFYYIRGRGNKQMEKELLRGAEIVDKKVLIRLIKTFIKKSPDKNLKEGLVSVGGVNIPNTFEVTNFLVIGDQGVKKSQLIFENIKRFRDGNKKAIIYDPSGDSIRKFYNPEKDIIINPLDTRSCSWNIWTECKKEYQLYSIAEALIEGDSRSKTDFFTIAARIVFISLVKKTNNISDLMNAIKTLSLDDLVIFLKGSDAAIIIDENGMRAAQSVRAVLLSNVGSLAYTEYMRGESFSIREWICENEEDGFLFITCPPNQLRMLKPLISIWIDIVLFSILSLEPSRQRIIGTFIDEFVSLNKLESFSGFLAQARKYGNCSFVGIQNISQLISVYGQHGAKEITGLCGNWVVFRSSEESNAEWISKNLYSQDVVEKNESTSFGSNSVRDGVNINETRQTRTLVTPTEIQSLPDGHAYLRIGRGFPISKIEQDYLNIDNINIGFSPIDDDDLVTSFTFGDTEEEKPVFEEVDNKEKKNNSNQKINFTDIDIDI